MANSDQTIATPFPFFRALENFLNIKFDYDMAANSVNTKCDEFFTEEDDSLNIDWPLDGWCWLNPPFRNLTKWINKCVEQQARGCKIVSIWPLSGDINQIPAWEQAKVHIIHGRIWLEVRGCMVCIWDNDYNLGDGIVGLRWDKKTQLLDQQWGIE